MSEIWVDQQQHGYRSGHQLLRGTIKLDRDDQDLVDRLSDMAGSIRPGETFDPYLTTYPLPSGQYYVVARTWQDLAAPRSGCVLTRSLFVPTFAWQAADSVQSFVELLAPVDRAQDDNARLLVPGTRTALAPVSDPRIDELVEALFLEKRQPILMFDVPTAELVAVRLLTALWPGLRRSFSLSTFALAPRTLGGRYFDLIFAPKTARSRFADWSGRRIEGRTPNPDGARHRWTRQTADQIFKSETPNLLVADSIGVLALDEIGSESALRLTLLWNELLEQSKSSPHAVLGMLDILNSQGTTALARPGFLTPLIGHAVTLAESTLSAAEAWNFIIALLGKFLGRTPPLSLLKGVLRVCGRLTERGPREAVAFVHRQEEAQRTIPPILFSAIGNGLANSLDTTLGVDGFLLARLVAYSKRFSAMSASATAGVANPKMIFQLKEGLNDIENDLRAKARRNLLPHLKQSAHAALLTPLLRSIDAPELGRAISVVWKSTQFSIPEFDEPLIHAAVGQKRMAAARSAITSVPGTSNSDRLLLGTLRLSASDVEWLCKSLDSQRARRLLVRLIGLAEPRDIEAVTEDMGSQTLLLDVLDEDIAEDARAIARLVLFGQLSLPHSLTLGSRLLSHLPDQGRADVISLLLDEGMSKGEELDALPLKAILDASHEVIDARHIIRAATATDNGERLSRNVVMLNGSRQELRATVLKRIDELSERLTRHTHATLNSSAINAWASLIQDANQVSSDGQLRAASIALPYALRRTKEPTSPLVVASFPVVYSELRRGKSAPSLFQIFLFVDWDRCKVARQDLVDAFLRSSWPPSDLVITASKADDAERILQHLVSTRRGQQYLVAIRNDIARQPKSSRIALAQELKRFKERDGEIGS